jgi:hypothetical protein
MGAAPLPAQRFVRRTQLGRDEYRKNFRQLDHDAISAVTSPEADAVTPLMGKVYLRLVDAPETHWEREGVLRFAGEEKDGEWVTAWEQLVSLLGVASATARKALLWMHEQGIIGYFAGKNGVGIRVFINRAVSSIGTRSAGKKILEFTPASSRGARTSSDEAGFSDSYADSEVLETDLNPRAPESGAGQAEVVKISSPRQRPEPTTSRPINTQTVRGTAGPVAAAELTKLLLDKLEPAMHKAAAQAAAREHERTREWLESKGLPKAARVAQREAYNVLRKYGVVRDVPSSRAEIGRGHAPQEHGVLSDNDVEELAQACVALLEVRGQSVEVTLSEMSTAAGGFLLPGDAPRVRAKAEALLDGDPRGS